MRLQDFILSEKRSDRIKRHVLFWAFWGFYFGAVRHFSPIMYAALGHFPNPLQSLLEAVLMLLPQMVLAYPLMYFVLPRYVFTGKYIRAIGWFMVFLLLTLTANALVFIYIPWYKIIWSPGIKLFGGDNSFTYKLFLAYLASLQGAVTGAALAASFKLFKHFYAKNLRNLQLQKENTEAQLQLLTAQVHPHFLFNTLNNIYSKAQTESPGSAKMIMELSHILRYVLDEGRQTRVPLENELQMIKDYINLEKMRYDDTLDLHFSFPSNTQNIYIAPLLLLPFVENCFKHGTSKMLRQPWINLKAELNGETLFVKIMNGKKEGVKNAGGRKGTGIENVQQRLDLLYKDKYDLQISEDEEVFVVNLKIELVRMQPSAIVQTTTPEKKYA